MIVLDWVLVPEIQTEGEIGRRGVGLELELRLAVVQASVRFGIETREIRPRVEITSAEDEARSTLRAHETTQPVGHLHHRRELAPLPELAVHEVAGAALEVLPVWVRRAERLRDRARLLIERRVRVLRLATRERRRVALEVVHAVLRAIAALVVE